MQEIDTSFKVIKATKNISVINVIGTDLFMVTKKETSILLNSEEVKKLSEVLEFMRLSKNNFVLELDEIKRNNF